MHGVDEAVQRPTRTLCTKPLADCTHAQARSGAKHYGGDEKTRNAGNAC